MNNITVNEVRQMTRLEILGCDADVLRHLFMESGSDLVLTALLLRITQPTMAGHFRTEQWLNSAGLVPIQSYHCEDGGLTWLLRTNSNTNYVMWFENGYLIKFGTIAEAEYLRLAALHKSSSME
jgi:hypothetical protein